MNTIVRGNFCKRCNGKPARCHCRKANKRSKKPKGGAAIVKRYGVPQSVVRARRGK